MMENKAISYESKENKTLPKGAKIVKKSCDVSIREIENGFLMRKSYDIHYTLNEQSDYLYYTKETYYKTDPTAPKEKMMLADLFN
tara:strand:+ start:986 stop:1240 length:255 start_codon:yes stop_codon:yes gene_type:complete